MLLISSFPIFSFGETYDAKKEYKKGDIIKVKVMDLHPTQFSIGEIEVQYRKEELLQILRINDSKKRKKLLKKEAGDVVIGPKGKLYLVDGHHHAKALNEVGEEFQYVKVRKNWKHLTEKAFQHKMENADGSRKKTRVYLKDERGRLKSFNNLPKTLAGLKNNDFRSIAFFLIEAEIIRKDGGKFPEFGEFLYVDKMRDEGIKTKTPSGRSRMKIATSEAAYFLTNSDNQKASLPGQRELSQRKCDKLLSKIEYLF